MKKPKMYAMCMSNHMLTLERGKEYLIKHVRMYKGFADCFFVLEDGTKYASTHFSVTYLK